MLGVLLAQDGMVGRNLPVDAKAVVEDGDATVCLWVIELITLVLEHGGLAQHGEAMGEATRDEELAMIVLGEFHRHVFAKGRRTLADINCHIEHRTLHATHQFALGERWALEMQTSHHAVGRHALVVLAEIHLMPQDRHHLLVKLPLREALEEIAPGILEDARLYHQYSFYISLDYFHFSIILE